MKTAWPIRLWRGRPESKKESTCSPTQPELSESVYSDRHLDSRSASVQDHILRLKSSNLNMCLGPSDPHISVDYPRPSLTTDRRSAPFRSTLCSQKNAPRTSATFSRIITRRESTTITREETPDKRPAVDIIDEDHQHDTNTSNQSLITNKHPSGLRAVFSVRSSFGRTRQAALPLSTACVTVGSKKSLTHSVDEQKEVGAGALVARTEPFAPARSAQTTPQYCARLPLVGALTASSVDDDEGSSQSSTKATEVHVRSLPIKSTTHVSRHKSCAPKSVNLAGVVPLSPKSLSRLYTDIAIQRKPVNLPERRSSRLVLEVQDQKIHSSCGSIHDHSVSTAAPVPSHSRRHSRFTNARKSVLSHSSSGASDDGEDMSILSEGNETSIIVGEAEIAEICVPGRPTSVYRNRRQTASLLAARRKSRLAKVDTEQQAPDSGIDCNSISSRFLPSPVGSSSPITSQSNTSPVSASRSTSFSASSPDSVFGDDVLQGASTNEHARDRRSRHLMALTSDEVAMLTDHRIRCSATSYPMESATTLKPITESTVPRLGRTTAVFSLTTKARASSSQLRPAASICSITSLNVGSTTMNPSSRTTPAAGGPRCPYHLSPELDFSSLDLDFANSKTTWPLTNFGVSRSASRRHPCSIEHHSPRGLGLSIVR